MGFCLFDNVAIAARHAQAELGLERVAIVDWDVHHGNGTQAIFADDDSVLFVSLHQWPFYPGTGGPDDQAATTRERAAAGRLRRRGVRARRSTTSSSPPSRAFEPDLVLVSAGFDAHERDPLAEMRVTEDGFRELARRSAALGAAGRGRARGRLQRRDAAGARRARRTRASPPSVGPKNDRPIAGPVARHSVEVLRSHRFSPFPWKRTI